MTVYGSQWPCRMTVSPWARHRHRLRLRPCRWLHRGQVPGQPAGGDAGLGSDPNRLPAHQRLLADVHPRALATPTPKNSYCSWGPRNASYCESLHDCVENISWARVTFTGVGIAQVYLRGADTADLRGGWRPHVRVLDRHARGLHPVRPHHRSTEGLARGDTIILHCYRRPLTAIP